MRYADDIVCGFEHEAEAKALLADLKARMETFALSLHPEKTRLIEFGRSAAESRKRRSLGKPETFTFLGFTHICDRTHRGKFLLERKTRRDRMRAKLKAIKTQLRFKMHEPIPVQGRWLGQVVRGYFASETCSYLFHRVEYAPFGERECLEMLTPYDTGKASRSPRSAIDRDVPAIIYWLYNGYVMYEMSAAQLDSTFFALADPTRRAILGRLAAGDATVGELTEPFAISQPAISRHLKVLEHAGLIRRARDAQRRPCRLELKPMMEACAWLERYRDRWESAYQRLDALLAFEADPSEHSQIVQ